MNLQAEISRSLPRVQSLQSIPEPVMRIVTTLPAIICGALLTGCAGSNEPVALPANHPANPVAVESPAAPISSTLSLASNPPTGMTSTTHEGHSNHSTASIGAASPSGIMYACPMHPEVTSANPNDKCPKCGMKINKPIRPTTGQANTPPKNQSSPAGESPAPAHQHKHEGH